MFFRCIYVFAEQNDRSAAEQPLSQRKFHLLIVDPIDVQFIFHHGEESHTGDEPALRQIIPGKGQGQPEQGTLFVRPEILQPVFCFSFCHDCRLSI